MDKGTISNNQERRNSSASGIVLSGANESLKRAGFRLKWLQTLVNFAEVASFLVALVVRIALHPTSLPFTV